MLTFNLKREQYEKARLDKEIIECRKATPYWNKRFAKEFCSLDVFVCGKKSGSNFFVYQPRHCVLRLGHTKCHMTAWITKLEVIDGKDTDLAIDAPVYAIHLADVREMIQCPHCKGNGAMLGDGLGVMECPWCGGDGEWEAENEQE